MKTLVARCGLVMLALAGAAAAAPLKSAVTREQVDVANCRVLHNGKAGALDEPRMLYALGVLPKLEDFWRLWTAGSVAGESKDGETFQYVVAFKQPVTIGSVLTTVRRVSVLKADAPFPGDPANAAQWTTVEAAAGVGPRLATFDAPAPARAVLFTEVLRSGNSTLGPVRFYAERLFNAAPLAGARAKTEYQAPVNFGGALYRAIDVARGRGSWACNGVNELGNVAGAYVSDLQPQWYCLAWEAPRTLTGLYLQDNFGEFKIDVFTGPPGITPLAGVDSEWTALKAAQYTVSSHQGRWIAFAEPVTTAGLRVRITKALTVKGADSQVARLDALLALEDLGAAAAPAVANDPPPPPLAIAYQAPQDGFLTMAVDDADGRRVRNLIAREARTAGPQSQAWDLADEAGKLVAPGAYRWKAITAPALELRYDQTVYPNVTTLHPENSAWLNGPDGPGGWLADHTPPRGGCGSDDFLFFGAPVPESGVGFAACDLTGRKLWGISSFAAWSAGQSMATDGKTVFVQHAGFGAYGSPDEGADRVWGVDIASHAWKAVYIAQNTEKRRRGVSGIAARDGKVVLAVNAVDNWLANAFGWDVVDVVQSRPFYKEPRKPKFPYEIVPDPRDDFLRLFRLKGTPPGCYALTYLESTLGSGKREHILLAFNRPVEIGSCVFPAVRGQEYKIKLSALKPDAPYPPNANKRDQWVDFERQAELAWDVAVAPSNATTRALLVTFYKGDEDDLTDLLDGEPDIEPGGPDEELTDKKDAVDLGLGGGANWRGQLEGMKILRRRFRNLFGEAKVRVNSGTVNKDGVWDAERTEPLSRAKPGIYVMEWPEPRSIRGLAIREIDGKLTEIDAYTGDGAPPADLAAAQGWELVGKHEQARRDHHSGFVSANMHARFMDGYVDFGREVKTRAIRLRVVEQWVDHEPRGSMGVRTDLGGMTLDPARCRVYGVAPLQPLGGEAPVDPLVAERLEVVDGATGKVEHEVGIRKPADLAYAPDGTLYAVSEGVIVKADLKGGKHQPFVTDVKKPGALTCDRQGNLYVFEGAPDQRVVRVYDPAGKFVRQVGEAGGYTVGPWNPNRFQELTALVVDREGKLWCVDTTYFPKRVSCWSPDGKFLREYLGPTCYGSAGVLDPGDKRRLFYGPMEFELDWDKGTSRLKNLTWDPADGWAAGEVPIRINDRTYLVTRPADARVAAGVGIVYLYEKDHLRRVAAVGYGDAFAALQNPDVLKNLGQRVLTDLQFIWADRNGDGVPQYAECDFQPRHSPQWTPFDERLEIQAGPYRYAIKEFLADGVPVYEEQKLPLPFKPGYGQGIYYRLKNGNYYRFAIDANDPEACFTPDGKPLWTYKQEGAGVGPDRSCAPYTPGQVVCQFAIAGNEIAPEGDLGEFYVINSNFGVWNLWTADGLLAGRIFRDLRDGQRVSWTMKEHERGMRLDDVTCGQEHFQAWFCRSRADGKYYAIAGHNHASVVEVAGLEKFKRLGGELKVTAEDVARAEAWTKEVVKFRAREEAKVLDCFSIEGTGLGKTWETMPVARLEADPLNPRKAVAFQMCHDQANLYLRYVVRGAGPFKNLGEQWDRMFKTGACVDLMLGLKSDADPKRRAPVEGDKRVLVSVLKGQPVAVLYDAVVPGTAKEQRWEAVSPVGRTEFDAVRKLDDAVVQYQAILSDPTDTKSVVGHILDVTLPFKSIGLVPKPGTRIRFDWGILETDQQGAAVLARNYWSNKSTSTLADAPTEARLEPDLWGWAIFPGRNKEAPSLTEPVNLLDDGKAAVEGFELEED